MKGYNVKLLYNYIVQLHLDRDDEVAGVRARIEAGKMSELSAKAYLYRWQEMIQRAIDFPNVLHEPPDEEQLYADGRPDIEIGTLDNGLRFGIRYTDKARSVICCGAAGSGKTCCIRQMVVQIAKRRNG